MKPQRGAAILTALLTVALVATLASAALWQQWRSIEVESAERARQQSVWVLVGALDWARLILREDARKGGADYLSEPWAVPLEPARLSTFLSADKSGTLEGDAEQDAFLSGGITDLQSRLNIANLVQGQGGAIDPAALAAFARLFNLLDLPPTELSALVANLRLAQASSAPGSPAAPSAATEAMAAPLWPQKFDQLAWLGLSASSIAALRPFVTILPKPTPVNLNTAPAQVIYACVEAFSLADAQHLVSERSATHMTTLTDASKLSGKTGDNFKDAQHSVTTQFFEVRGQLQVGQVTTQELSVVQRDGLDVKTLWRQHGVASPGAALQ